MTRQPRRNHSPAFKGKVALAAIRGEQTLVELSQQFDVHANQIKQWKDQLLKGATGVFGDEAKAEPAGPTVDVKTLHAKIGELTLENDFIRCARLGGIAGLKEMIDLQHKLSVVRQAKLLGFSRGSVYYLPRPVSDGDLALMRRIDELHLDYPFAGSRRLQGLLRGEGLETGRQHVATLMKKMGIEAITVARTRRNRHLGTKSIPTFCESWRSPDPTRTGRWTRPMFRWLADSSISAPLWTGSVGRFCRGGCRSRWRQPSASKQSRKRWPVMADPTYSIRTRNRSSPRWTSRRC